MTREPTEMELRVARALSEKVVSMDQLVMARAAIRAMREPTEEMVVAGYDNAYGRGADLCLDYGAMIDAASPQHS